MSKEIFEAIENEVEMYSEEDYDNMLDKVHGEFMGYSASQILKAVDPIAYRCGFSDYQEYKTVYECPICGEEHEDEDDAKYCCQVEEEEEEEEED